MKKHAYLIMAHSNSYVLERLLKLLDDERNDVFVHIDKKVKNFDFTKCEHLCKNAKVVFLKKRVSVTWGNESQIKAELLLFEKARKTNSYHYYHFISGSDLPLKTQDEIHFFFENKKENYLFYYDEPTIYDLQRISLYRNPIRGKSRLTKELNGMLDILQAKFKINRLRKLKKYPIIRRGWNWCDLTQEAVDAIVLSKKEILHMMRFTVCSDEMYKQMILLNAGIPVYKERETDGIRYIDWSNGGNHPHTFVMDDYDRLMKSGMLFARKFDDKVDKTIVDKIYNSLRRVK